MMQTNQPQGLRTAPTRARLLDQVDRGRRDPDLESELITRLMSLNRTERTTYVLELGGALPLYLHAGSMDLYHRTETYDGLLSLFASALAPQVRAALTLIGPNLPTTSYLGHLSIYRWLLVHPQQQHWMLHGSSYTRESSLSLLRRAYSETLHTMMHRPSDLKGGPRTRIHTNLIFDNRSSSHRNALFRLLVLVSFPYLTAEPYICYRDDRVRELPPLTALATRAHPVTTVLTATTVEDTFALFRHHLFGEYLAGLWQYQLRDAFEITNVLIRPAVEALPYASWHRLPTSTRTSVIRSGTTIESAENLTYLEGLACILSLLSSIAPHAKPSGLRIELDDQNLFDSPYKPSTWDELLWGAVPVLMDFANLLHPKHRRDLFGRGLQLLLKHGYDCFEPPGLDTTARRSSLYQNLLAGAVRAAARHRIMLEGSLLKPLLQIAARRQLQQLREAVLEYAGLVGAPLHPKSTSNT